jgi:hypothetical protein
MNRLLRNPLALVLLVGSILLVRGYNASRSLESQISSVVGRSPSIQSICLYMAGAICIVLGLVQIARRLL